MESWEDSNYYTTNETRWVELMNASTSDWGLGYLPAGLVAISGNLNSTYHFDNTVLVIENASRTLAGSNTVESVVFGLTSALALIWAVVWLVKNRDTMLKPERISTNNAAASREGSADYSTLVEATGEEMFVTAAAFKEQLLHFYYEPVETEIEVLEKDAVADGVVPEDVEAVTVLLRKMYNLDLGLWSLQNALYVTEAEREWMRDQSDAILAEVRRIVGEWQSQSSSISWSQPEMRQLEAISWFLENDLPDERYGNRSGQ
ncbi:hypothetical protein F4677DRAFT_430203 [Hypoxylon crocopeplum]|nr:hypothetical protein F4677DRAFT_430203 [Hypoxylon crocopeplum]